jgi:hypothetical protein
VAAAPLVRSGGWLGKEVSTVEEAAQAIADAFDVTFGEITIRVQDGRVYLVEPKHQLRAADAGKVKL